MQWAKAIGDEAMKIVSEYELLQDRNSEEVHTRGVGYDIHSFNSKEERYIEVKGISEKWSTYTWQSLHHTTVKCLKENPDKFFLYIVHFNMHDDMPRTKETVGEIYKSTYDIYILSGDNLLHDGFSLKSVSYSLTPISRRRLEDYKVNNI